MLTIGVDEVGRGCWAGPVVAGAVVLQKPIAGLRDSKLLSKVARKRLADLVIQAGNPYGIGWVGAAELDRIGLTAAVRLAMERAVTELGMQEATIIVDGAYNFLAHLPNSRALVKADATVPAVSAASIIAKVARDQYMAQLPAQYDQYEFDRHVGYGTARHRELLMKYGPSEIHRRSFKPIKALLQ